VGFVIKEEAIAVLDVLRLGVGEEGMTERVTSLTESRERLFAVAQGGTRCPSTPPW
jgi:hypothetical protein